MAGLQLWCQRGAALLRLLFVKHRSTEGAVEALLKQLQGPVCCEPFLKREPSC